LRDWITDRVLTFYRITKPSKRTLRQITAAVDCVIANLVEAHQISRRCFVAISRRESDYTLSRYSTVNFGYTNLIRVLDYFEREDPPFVDFKKGFHDPRGDKAIGKVSRYRASDHFARLIAGYDRVIDQYRAEIPFDAHQMMKHAYKAGATSGDTSRALVHSPSTYRPSSDVIRLKNSEGTLIDYEDSKATNEMRDRLRRWNAFAEGHHLDLLLPDAELEAIFDKQEDAEEEEIFFQNEHRSSYVELTRSHLHRVFNNGSFDQGGRFYGGWWQGIPSRYRRYITIDEHATREFDYSNLHAAMLYAREGLALPDDAYALPGISAEYRKLIKKSFFKLINAGPHQAVQAPRGSALPPGWTWAQLQAAIKEKHAPIRTYFNSGAGISLQRLDSEIAELIMIRMMEKETLVLPVHDSFITYHELQSDLHQQMAAAYRETMQSEIGIDADPSFIEQWNDEADIGVLFDASDVVENVEARQDYDGFRRRHWAFVRSKRPE